MSPAGETVAFYARIVPLRDAIRNSRLRGGNPVSNENLSQTELRSADFETISQLVYKLSGIRLTSGKEQLVRSRLAKRLRSLGLPNFSAYLRFVKEDRTAQELNIMIDSLTTNKTSFFRENQHFDYMRACILPELKKSRAGIRLWSAGCSSGEEPYSIAMLLREEWPSVERSRLRILATDISARMLTKAQAGEYDKESLHEIPSIYLSKYFDVVSSNSARIYRVHDSIKTMVQFARLNLMDRWPMKGSFDVIFCRNVMIYFDSQTQRDLIERFYDMLVPGGHLLVGHSESLAANSRGFRYVQPATYRKSGGGMARPTPESKFG
jgi:chemotaxis protein methyltransferase CheR